MPHTHTLLSQPVWPAVTVEIPILSNYQGTFVLQLVFIGILHLLETFTDRLESR